MKIGITPIICVHVHAGGKRGFRIHGSNGWIYGIFQKTKLIYIHDNPVPPSLPHRLQQVVEEARLQTCLSCPEPVMWADCDGLANGIWRCPWKLMAMPISKWIILHKYLFYLHPLHCTNSLCNPSNMHGGKVMCPNGFSELCWIGG